MKKKCVLVATILAGCVGLTVSAADLALWNFTGETVEAVSSSTTFNSSTTAPAGVVLSALRIHDSNKGSSAYSITNTPLGTAQSGLALDGNAFRVTLPSMQTASGSGLTDGNYTNAFSLDFTFTVQSGFEADLSSLAFTYGYDGASGSITTYFGAIASVDGGAFVDLLGSGTPFGGSNWMGVATTTSTYDLKAANIDLSALGTLAEGQSVIFKVVVAANSASATRTALLDNIKLTGNVTAVPEPSVYAGVLGGLVLLGVVLRRRR